MISVEPAIEKFHLPPSLVKWRMSSRGQEEGRGGALTAVASVTSGSTVISTFMLPATISRMLSDRASYNWKHTEALYHINLQRLQILWMLLMSLFSWVWPVQGLVLFSQDSRWRWARLVFPVWERGGRGQGAGASSAPSGGRGTSRWRRCSSWTGSPEATLSQVTASLLMIYLLFVYLLKAPQ